MDSDELAIGPLGRLGARLAELLDDDQWNNIEPMLVTIKADQEAEIRKLQIALRIKTEEHDCCSEDLGALRAKAELADEFLEEIKNNWPDWSPMNSPAEIIVDLINERNEKIDEREAIHAMCVCMAARLEDCAKALVDQAEVCRVTGYFDGALTVNEFAAAARKIIKEWEEL